MKYLITRQLDAKEKSKIVEKGLYCYDLRLSDLGDKIASIEEFVFFNRVGSMITNEQIPLGDKYPNDFVDYETFIANNQAVDKIEELLSNRVKKSVRNLDNNMYVMDLGYRNEKPVALVKKTAKYGIEYIIAIDYKIIDNKIEWGYGYYYDSDKNKAIKDFKRVLAGESLENTFTEKKKDKNMER